ncbi:MAG: excinuclease ABC subunit UvrA [Myxococcales bacterium]
MTEPDKISVRGAREHNLKNVDLDIPKKRLVVFTGVSGSGKSSLAFDTLYAEGQRRYVESLSAYARQFLGQMDKPKYDTIRGLSPTISIEQKAASNNPRSTVGTVTEIHDYLRVLYASIGVQHCPQCGQKVGKQSAQQMVEEILKQPQGAKFTVLAPVVVSRKGEYKDILDDLRKRGLPRVRIDGKIYRLDEDRVELDKKLKHDIHVVIERLIMKPDLKARLTDAVEVALKEGKGQLTLSDEKSNPASDRVFSELNACLKCGLSFGELSPPHFSFNNPLGMCPECNGLGTRLEMDPDLIVPDRTKSIREGAVEPWASALARFDSWTAEIIDQFSTKHGIDLDAPFHKLPKKHQDLVLHGNADPENGRPRPSWGEFEGVVNQLMRRFKQTESETMRRYYMRYFSSKPCTTCAGARLKPESRAVKIQGNGIVETSALTIDRAFTWLESLPLSATEEKIAHELLKEIRNRLGFLRNVGLGYLTLDRSASTLSGGESQRIRLASQIGSELTGVIYILDEPSIGLHQRDNGKLLATLKRLRDIGNTVIVVEHDEETIRDADWVVDFGPGAGELGGEIVVGGTVEEVGKDAKSVTGAYLSGRQEIAVPISRRVAGKAKIRVEGASENNLKGIDVDFPLGLFLAVTGVSGAGKSTLVNDILYPALSKSLYDTRENPGKHKAIKGLEHLDKVINIDQRPIGRTPRSNPATYTKVFDAIRELFAQTPEAKTYGYAPGRFSFNVKGGRCEECEGGGVKLVEMHFLPDVYVTCEACGGHRFNEATLRVRYKGKNIAEVLDMSVREALEHFAVHREIVKVLTTLSDVGLGYMKLGQSSTTLSGGEAQRIKLSRELAKTATGRTLYVLDEPTTGLHFEDIQKLLIVLNRLVDAGNTVLVIEHNLDVIKCADWIVDLGPEGGDAGGRLVSTGTPEEVAKDKASATGQYLKRTLAGHAVPLKAAVE